jgi:hypothetical protein
MLSTAPPDVAPRNPGLMVVSANLPEITQHLPKEDLQTCHTVNQYFDCIAGLARYRHIEIDLDKQKDGLVAMVKAEWGRTGVDSALPPILGLTKSVILRDTNRISEEDKTWLRRV